MAKITQKIDYAECPKCKSGAMVMGMKTGNVHVYGCIKCRNAQGLHMKMKDAKSAWKHYVQEFSPTKRGQGDE